MNNQYIASKILILINNLNHFTKAYDEGHPMVSDEEWDKLYFELKMLENETGIIYPDSPTQTIIYKKVDYLNKVTHEYQPMLSLDKTKDAKEVEAFCFKDPNYWDWFGMFKLDGLSCRLTYINGNLSRAETRGNGIEGEDITHNALVILNIPKHIQTDDEVVVVDGEVICKTFDFEKFSSEFKNPRNFAAGSIRLLDAKECARRKLSFVAWDLIKGCEDIDFNFRRLEQLDDWGFETVPRVGDTESIADTIEALDALREKFFEYPIDGYVFKFESKKYCEKQGRTEHHFNSAIAYKFYDEEYETELLDIEWSLGRTGILTPVAIFKPIDIDGTVIERSSLHNLSVMQETLGCYPEQHQKIWVAKMNMIIPQITRAEKNDMYHDHILDNGYITLCPICGKEVKVVTSESGTRNIVCTNPSCEGQLVNRLEHFCGLKGLDIKGISKATLGKLIDWGYVNGLIDIFKLDRYKIEWISKPGFGEASVNKLLASIDAKRRCAQLDAFLSALGIPLIGRTVSKEIVKYYPTWQEFRDAVGGRWSDLDGFGYEMEKAINNFDYTEADEIVNAGYVTFSEKAQVEIAPAAAVQDKTFCITGKVKKYKNRAELKEKIELLGGKVTESVTKNTDYLINNDVNSTSSKNKKAKELGIPIISEEDFEKFLKTT